VKLPAHRAGSFTLYNLFCHGLWLFSQAKNAMKHRSKIMYILEYIGLRFFCCVIKALPDSVSIKAGRTIGTISARFLKQRIKLAHSNLEHAYGEALSFEERSSIIHKLSSLLGEALIESIICKGEDAEKNISVEGMEHLYNALKMNKGVLILGPHFGLWELAGYIFGSALHNASTVYKPLKNSYINNYLLKIRRKTDIGLIPSKNALKLVLQNLKKGSAVVILFDQNAGKGGVPVKFFGKTAFTYSAPAAFALKTGCPVVPAYIIKDSGFRKHRLIIKEPFLLINTGNKEKDILANTQQYNDFLEALVRRHPEQWFGWLHRRWKIPRKYAEEQQ
jgi:KDO2-lipid IV(A) lauroyltransferase